MKFSKFLMVGAVGVCGVLASAQAFAQNEAVNADDVLAPKAQEQVQKPSEPTKTQAQIDLEKGLAEAKVENEDKETLGKKLALAKTMHEIRPVRVQVDAAVKRVSERLPAYERQNFVVTMQSMLNYNAIERISTDAMVDTYTLEELKSMVEYFSKPEARSASTKVNSWARSVHPEIVKMIDRAMMRIKTGQ